MMIPSAFALNPYWIGPQMVVPQQATVPRDEFIPNKPFLLNSMKNTRGSDSTVPDDCEGLLLGLEGKLGEELVCDSAQRIFVAVTERYSHILTTNYDSVSRGRLKAQLEKQLEWSWISSTYLAARLITIANQYVTEPVKDLELRHRQEVVIIILQTLEKWCNMRSALGIFQIGRNPPKSLFRKLSHSGLKMDSKQLLKSGKKVTMADFVDSLEISGQMPIPQPPVQSDICGGLANLITSYIDLLWKGVVEAAIQEDIEDGGALIHGCIGLACCLRMTALLMRIGYDAIARPVVESLSETWMDILADTNDQGIPKMYLKCGSILGQSLLQFIFELGELRNRGFTNTGFKVCVHMIEGYAKYSLNLFGLNLHEPIKLSVSEESLICSNKEIEEFCRSVETLPPPSFDERSAGGQLKFDAGETEAYDAVDDLRNFETFEGILPVELPVAKLALLVAIMIYDDESDRQDGIRSGYGVQLSKALLHMCYSSMIVIRLLEEVNNSVPAGGSSEYPIAGSYTTPRPGVAFGQSIPRRDEYNFLFQDLLATCISALQQLSDEHRVDSSFLDKKVRNVLLESSQLRELLT